MVRIDDSSYETKYWLSFPAEIESIEAEINSLEQEIEELEQKTRDQDSRYYTEDEKEREYNLTDKEEYNEKTY